MRGAMAMFLVAAGGATALAGLAASPIAAQSSEGTTEVTAADTLMADSLAGAEFARDSLASMTVGVIVGDRLVWTHSYGYADMATHKPATRRTVYRIGSITKPFTAVMLLQLIEAGKLHLSDPVERYFPEIRQVQGLPAGSAPITFLQLATMTAGLAQEPRTEGPFWTGPVAKWESTLISALPHTNYIYTPGTRFSYSNIGYAILGAALSRVAHESYVDWERQHILTPLGMTRTRFEVDPEISGDLAQGYTDEESGAPTDTLAAREARTGRGYKVPNGALFTTIDDLAKFVVFELGHGPDNVLPRAVLDTAFAGLVVTDDKMRIGYGLGFMALRNGAFTWTGHTGGVAGFTSAMFFDRTSQRGVIVFRNATGGKARIDVASAILERLSKTVPVKSAAAH